MSRRKVQRAKRRNYWQELRALVVDKTIVLTATEAEHLARILLDPPKPSPQLEELFRRYSQ